MKNSVRSFMLNYVLFYLPSSFCYSTKYTILILFRKYNLGDTEKMLKDEMRKREVVKPSIVQQASAENEVGNVLAKYRNDGDPCHYEAAYR